MEEEEEELDRLMIQITESIWQLVKWAFLQNITLFLMSYVLSYNFGLSILITLYTFIFGIYFLAIRKKYIFHWLLFPYAIYASLAILCNKCWGSIFPSAEVSLFFPIYGAAYFIIIKIVRRNLRKRFSKKVTNILAVISVIVILPLLKGINTELWCKDHGNINSEKQEILERRNYLVSKIVTTPARVMNTMPSKIDEQFKGEWALYSCSMLSAALTNISSIYPETQKDNLKNIDSLIQIVMSPTLSKYDKERWEESPLSSLDGDKSHISYLSHLAWMISGYKTIGGNSKYDELFTSVCKTMNRRIINSKILNLPTYPDEAIYIPDMLVAIVALSQYSQMNGGKYSSTVNSWLKRARTEWIDKETGLLVSFLDNDGKQIEGAPIKGSYSALNCSYLSYIDEDFANEQYKRFKTVFWKDDIVSGIKEYYDNPYIWGLDMDAGPIILGLSPSGTAFATGAVTYFGDYDIRNKILRTAEIAGHTIKWSNNRHYALAEVALVGEAIMLAMRTNYKECKVHNL